jgi:hypothetical protein
MLLCTSVIYGFYAAFLLIEVLDFLSLLHSAPPGWHATYSIVNVAFSMVDMTICLSFGFAFLLLKLNGRRRWTAVLICLALTIARAGLIYYLYVNGGPSYRGVPYIYKTANVFSNPMRVVCLPLQVLFGFLSAVFCRPAME